MGCGGIGYLLIQPPAHRPGGVKTLKTARLQGFQGLSMPVLPPETVPTLENTGVLGISPPKCQPGPTRCQSARPCQLCQHAFPCTWGKRSEHVGLFISKHSSQPKNKPKHFARNLSRNLCQHFAREIVPEILPGIYAGIYAGNYTGKSARKFWAFWE